MPLDPSIILGGQPAPQQSPLQAISAIAQLQDVQAQVEQRRLAGEAARQKAMDDAQVRSVFAAAGGDQDAALKQLYTVNPRAAATLAEQVGKARKEQLDAMGKDLTNQKLRAELALQIGHTVNDASSYGLARPAMVATSPVLDKILPPADAPWDPDRWSQIMQAGLSGKDLLEHKQKVVDLFANGKVNEAVGTALSNLNPADPTAGAQATKYLDGAKALGAPEAVLAPYRALLTPDGAWAPDASARAAALTISPKEHETLAGEAATRAETAARDAANQATAVANLRVAQGHLAVSQAGERRQAANPELVQVMRDGQAVWIPKAQAVGQPAAGGAAGRPATGTERQALAYYNRGQQALDTLTTPDPTTGQTLEDSVSGEGLKLGDLPVIGNYFQSQAAQAYQQAQRAFTEARLRKESGATIKADEYESDRKTYFKQPGDSAATVEQKRLARQKVLNGLAFSSGKAYEEYYGVPFTRETGKSAAPAASSETRVRVVGPNGQTGTVPPGTDLPPGWRKQ